MSEALIEAVTASAQNPGDSDTGAFDVDAGVFDGFEARLENLHWRENDDGVLMAGNARMDPGHVVSIEVVGGELEVTEEDPSDVPWRDMRRISSPERATSPQFD